MTLYGNTTFFIGGPAYAAGTPVGAGSPDDPGLSSGVGGGIGTKEGRKDVSIYYYFMHGKQLFYIGKNLRHRRMHFGRVWSINPCPSSRQLTWLGVVSTNLIRFGRGG